MLYALQTQQAHRVSFKWGKFKKSKAHPTNVLKRLLPPDAKWSECHTRQKHQGCSFLQKRNVDNGEQDDKIIGVAANDPFMQKIKNLNDIDPATLDSIKHFFEEYKKPEGKIVKINNFFDKDTAYKVISKSINLYKKNF